jgi:hypothetical protein
MCSINNGIYIVLFIYFIYFTLSPDNPPAFPPEEIF